MKSKELYYIFETTFSFSFIIWFIMEIITINTITYNCHVDFMNKNIYMYINNIENGKLMFSANVNNIWLILFLMIFINITLIFIINYARHKRDQRKQIKCSLLKEVVYIFEIIIALFFIIWILMKIIDINAIMCSNEEYLIDKNDYPDLMYQLLYIYDNNIYVYDDFIKNKQLTSLANLNNMWLIIILVISINFIGIFKIIYEQYKRTQKKQTTYSLIPI